MERKRTASHTDAIKIHERLKEVLKVYEDGKCDYISGHTDDTIGTEFNLGPHSVASVRVEFYGKLKSQSRGRSHATRARDKAIADLANRMDLLIDNLYANQVIDCRHLKKEIPE